MSLLERIRLDVEKRLHARRQRTPARRLEEALPSRLLEPRFRRALAESPRPAVIAEFKRRSPSESALAPGLRPELVAAEYARAGAAALSVLTEEDHFGGSLDDLRAAKEAAGLPVLRKDFLFDSYQLLEAKAAGADAALVILSMTGENLARELLAEARALRLDVLVEVHDEEEMAAARRLGADLVGVNNRNLSTLRTSLDVSRRLAGFAPEGALLVSESGLRSSADLAELSALGYGAFLIGTSLLAGGRPGAALVAMREGA